MSGLSKDKFGFDPADAADSDNIGAYMRAGSDGDLISSTNVGGKEGVDANIINASLVVTATDLDIRDLSHSQDSVKVGDGTDFLAINADGSINVNLTDDGVADDVADSGNPLKVGGKAYASLSADPVDDGDRANLAQDLYRRVFIHDAPNMSVLQQRVVIGATAVAIPTTALAGRTRVMVQNAASNPVWVGSATVTTSGATMGIKVEKGGTLALEAGEDVELYAIAAGAGNDVVVIELA